MTPTPPQAGDRAEALAVAITSPTFTMREIVQALTEHYKDQTGDQRQVPAAIMAFETMQQLSRIIERNRKTEAIAALDSEESK